MPSSNGWQDTLEQVGTGFFPASVGAGSTTKITDYYYQNSGYRVMLLGGDANDGANNGAFYLSAGSSLGYSHEGISSVLAY